VRGGRLNEEGEGGRMWMVYFVYMYENRTVKSVEIVLRKGKGRSGRLMHGREFN
jgi:hypothetical protein